MAGRTGEGAGPEWAEWAAAFAAGPITLDEAYVIAQRSIQQAAAYYAAESRRKRIGSLITRPLTIVAVVLGGVIPLAATIWPALPATAGYIALAVAAGLALTDRAFGFSDGWSRMMGARLRLEQLASGLAFEYSRSRAESPDDRGAAWTIVIEHSAAASAIVTEETTGWAGALATVTEDLRAQSRGRVRAHPTTRDHGVLHSPAWVNQLPRRWTGCSARSPIRRGGRSCCGSRVPMSG